MNDLSVRPSFLVCVLLSLVVTTGCDDSKDPPNNSTGGATSGGAGGAATTGGAGGTSGSGSGGTSGSGPVGGLGSPPGELPVPPGPDDVAPPSGDAANLRVLPWAGFGAAVSYTIDDSQPSLFEHWPALKATGVRMTLYVNPSGNWIAGYDATLKEAIAAGHELGNHTMNHCHADLSGCTKNLGSIEQEIDGCSEYIKTNLGQSDVWTIAYPFGEVAYAPASRTRFTLGRGVGSGTLGPKDPRDAYQLPVLAAAGGEAASVFNGYIDTALTQGRWAIFLFHTILPSSSNWYAGVDIKSITDSVEHAKDLEKVWIDSAVNVGAYWLGQRAFEAAETVEADGETTWTWTLPALFPEGRVLRVAVDGGSLSQAGKALEWDGHGYYEIALDEGSLTWSAKAP